MKEVRLLGDRILVHLDNPLKTREVDGVILYYPEGAFGSEGEINVWGTVEAVGPGRFAKDKYGRELGHRTPMEVKEGDRVMVIWFLSKVESNRQLQTTLGENRIIVVPSDIMCVDPKE
jgi:co-chaperonin GroES (HSP10)